LYDFEGFSDAVASGGTGGYYGHVRAFGAKNNGNGARGHVADEHGYEEWAYAPRPFFQEGFVLFLPSFHPAYAGAD
jgi:hypothetical protein